MKNSQDHHVTIRLLHIDVGDERIPYKWRGDCTCGYGCISWQWVAVDRPGGALPMALEHVGLISDSDLYFSEPVQ